MKSTVHAYLENDYRFYRLPLFKATAVKYGWNNSIEEDSGVRYIGLKHRYMSFAISLTEHDIVQLLDDDSREESGSGTYYERECDALFDIDGRGNTERLVAGKNELRRKYERL